MNNLKTLKEYINSQINRINNQIEKYRLEDTKYQQNIKELSSIIKIIETDVTKIDIDKLQEKLSLFETPNEVEYDLNKLKEAISLYKFLIDPRIPNQGVKQDILNFVQSLKNKLNNYLQSYSIKGTSQRHYSPKHLLELEKTYAEYLSVFSDEGFIKILSQEKMNEFFDFLENSDLDRNTVLELVTNYTKYIVNNSRKRKQLQVDIVEKKTDENAGKLLEELKNSIEIEVVEEIQETPIQEEQTPTITLELTEEEQEIKEKVTQIINEHRNELSKVGAEIAVQLFNKFTLDIRESLYLKNNSIDWDFVVADYDINLVKNLATRKEEVLEIFKFIVQKNDEFLEKQKQQEEKKNTFLELIKELEIILDDNESILYDFSQKQPNVQNLYNMTYEKIKQGNIEEAKNIAPHLKIEEIAIVCILKDMKEYWDIIELEKEEIDHLGFDSVIEDLEDYINKFNEYDKQLEESESIVEIQEESISSRMLNYDSTKNLILLCKNGNDKFCPLEGINNENLQDIQNIREHEFLKALQCFATRDLENRKKELKARKLKKFISKKKEKYIEEIYGISAERLRFSEKGRTGYVLVPVHEENRKKLRNIYGDNIFSPFNSIPMIVGSIFCRANHEDYNELTDNIKDNIDYIRNIINLFGNPNTDINKLTNIIEESMSECRAYVNKFKERK